MLYEIPLVAAPNQEFYITLAEQDCRIAVYDRGGRIYLDLEATGEHGTAIITEGAVCAPGAPIIWGRGRQEFIGNLYLIDSKSAADVQAHAEWQGLGERWKLYYATPDIIAEWTARDRAAALELG